MSRRNETFFIVIALITISIIALNCFCSFIYIFKNVRFINSKAYVLLSKLTLLIFILACLIPIAEPFFNPSSWRYGDFEQLYYAFYQRVAGTFYLECVVLLFNILIEIAKRFVKMPYSKEDTKKDKQTSADELKKFKELLDMGAITQQEFDEKKSQLLNL